MAWYIKIYVSYDNKEFINHTLLSNLFFIEELASKFYLFTLYTGMALGQQRFLALKAFLSKIILQTPSTRNLSNIRKPPYKSRLKYKPTLRL